jgi:hypothetical protein
VTVDHAFNRVDNVEESDASRVDATTGDENVIGRPSMCWMLDKRPQTPFMLSVERALVTFFGP